MQPVVRVKVIVFKNLYISAYVLVWYTVTDNKLNPITDVFKHKLPN